VTKKVRVYAKAVTVAGALVDLAFAGAIVSQGYDHTLCVPDLRH
jgi:hypothetical protein